MAHSTHKLTENDTVVLGHRAWPWFAVLMIVGAVCVAVALLISLFLGGGTERFGFAYLTAYSFVFAITLGALFFVIITHLFRAGWCAAIRRLAECYARNFPLMGILFLPIAAYVLTWTGTLYPWAQDFDHGAAAAYEQAAREGGSMLVDPLGEAGEAPAELIMETGAGEAFGRNDQDPAGTGGTAADPAHVEPHAAGTMGEVTDHDGDHAAEPDHADAHHSDTHGAHGAHSDDAHHGGHGDHHETVTYTGDIWADHDHAVAYFVETKQPWFNLGFWSLRWVLYLAIFSAIAIFYHRLSVKQDQTGDPELTNTREWWAPLSIIAFALTTMAVACDLILGLDPVWFSTMFGVIYFTNGITGALCVLILSITALKKMGYLPAVNTEHQHDLTKLLFAFVFFWGYTAFSQFMLIWYASLPETTYWFEMRGITGRAISDGIDAPAATAWSGWTWFSIFVLVFHLFLPFAILLSRHVKRNATARTVMAVWMLIMVLADMFWNVMPHYSSPALSISPVEILLSVGLLAFTVAGALRHASKHSLVAKGDPRMHESLALDTEVWAPIYPKPAAEPKADPGTTGHPTMA